MAFNGVSGTGNTRSALFMEVAVLILYVLFVYVAGIRLRLSVAVCFLTEAIYYSGLLVASVIYLKKASWKLFVFLYCNQIRKVTHVHEAM